MIISPSVLSLDFSKFSEQINEINESQAEWLHFDVMDGHFVPNLTFGPDLLKGFRKCTLACLDVHIMVSDPIYFSGVFINAGAEIITFHREALQSDEACIELARSIRSKGCKAGISIKPGTAVESIREMMAEFDVVLIMSVEPGFGGQSFMTNALEKIRTLRKIIDENGYSTRIQVDGGINGETAKLCKDAGVDVLVAGSFIFKEDIKKAVAELCAIV